VTQKKFCSFFITCAGFIAGSAAVHSAAFRLEGAAIWLCCAFAYVLLGGWRE
jgi:hypothetical protein